MSRDSVPLFLEKRSWWFVALPEIYLAGCASLCFFFLDSKEDAERPGTRVESYSKLNRRSRTFCRGSTVCRDHTSFFIFVYTVWWIWAALVFKNYDNDPEICCIRCSGYSGDSRKEFNRVSWFFTSLFLFLYILVDFLIRCFNQRSLIMKNQQTAIWTKIYRVHIKKNQRISLRSLIIIDQNLNLHEHPRSIILIRRYQIFTEKRRLRKLERIIIK